MNVLGSITIGMSPNIAAFGGLLLSWHGVFTFIAVATVVGLVLRWGMREGMQPDPVLSICVWSIIGGILGARLVHGAQLRRRPGPTAPVVRAHELHGGSGRACDVMRC